MQTLLTYEALNMPVVVQRRKGTRSITIRIRSNGTVSISVPTRATDKYIQEFIASKHDWLVAHAPKKTLLVDGNHIGKSHRIVIVAAKTNSVRTRVIGQEIRCYVPENTPHHDAKIQKAIEKAAEKALKLQADTLLPQRIEYISKKIGIQYRSITTKKLTSRWGSCDHVKNIVLNIYLMQHSWDCIDYVIIHELSHTLHPHHQASFWDEVRTHCSNYKQLRSQLKSAHTQILPTA